MVQGVGGDGEDGVLREVVIVDGDAGAGGNEAREPEGRGGVDAEGFGDYVVETGRTLVFCSCRNGSGGGGGVKREEDLLGQVLDGGEIWDRVTVWNGFVELLLQLLHNAGGF